MAIAKRGHKIPLFYLERCKNGEKLRLVVGPSAGLMLVALVNTLLNNVLIGSLGTLVSGAVLASVGHAAWRWWRSR